MPSKDDAFEHYHEFQLLRESVIYSPTVAVIAIGWSEPVSGRELHPLESSDFHGVLLQHQSGEDHDMLRPVVWIGNSRKNLQDFPEVPKNCWGTSFS